MIDSWLGICDRMNCECQSEPNDANARWCCRRCRSATRMPILCSVFYAYVSEREIRVRISVIDVVRSRRTHDMPLLTLFRVRLFACSWNERMRFLVRISKQNTSYNHSQLRILGTFRKMLPDSRYRIEYFHNNTTHETQMVHLHQPSFGWLSLPRCWH